MKPANSRGTCLQPGQGHEFEGGVRIPEPSAISKEMCLFEQQRLTKAANARANCLQPGQGHGVSEASASWSSEITKATMAGQSGAGLPAGSSLYSAACQTILHVVCGCCTKASHVLAQHDNQQPQDAWSARCKHRGWNATRAKEKGRTSCSTQREQCLKAVNHITQQQATMIDSPLQEGTLVHHAASNPLAGPSGGSAVTCEGSCARTCASVASACPSACEQQVQRTGDLRPPA